LKNDYKELMNVIEKHIHEHFAKQAENAEAATPLTNGHTRDIEVDSRPAPQVLTPPFAKVNSVVAGSPAADAGLMAGDLIRLFGYVNNANHDGLKRVGECVQGNEGVSVSRSSLRAHINLCSKTYWSRSRDQSQARMKGTSCT
jgi:26S proteasome non-ATPase regulatory subunit 9